MGKFLPIFFLIAAIFQLANCTKSIRKEKKDPLLEKVERWILYSIDTGYDDIHKHFGSFLPPKINSDLQFLHDFMDGKCFIPTTNTSDHHLTMDIPDLVLKLIENNFKEDIAKSLNALHPQYAVRRLDQAKCKMHEIFEENADQRPIWMRTLLKIGDLFVWQHFWAFKIVLEVAYQTRDTSFSIREHTRLGKFEPFCTKADIKIDKIMEILDVLGHSELDRTTVKVFELGEKVASSMLHMVLYSTLRRTIGDIVLLENLGDDTIRAMTERDYTVYQLVYDYNKANQFECHQGMPRRDYVVYWLRRMYDSLKHNYKANCAKFKESLKSKPAEQNSELQTLFREWAKCVPYWDKLLETLEKHGIQVLDITINLFGPNDRSYLTQLIEYLGISWKRN